MKDILLISAFCGLVFQVKSQTTSVEKSIFGIQTGFLGVWVYNETKLSNSISLRSEIGIDLAVWFGTSYEKTGFALSPVIRVEPRWYYNLGKRESKSKNIDGNSGNFLSLQTSYHSDWFVISNTDNVSVPSYISIIPTWGIRRKVGNHFTFETGIGIGYSYVFAKQLGFPENESEVGINLLLRIGYNF